MLNLKIPAVSMGAILIVTFLFSLKDNSAQDVRLRFLFMPIIAMILYGLLEKMR